MKFGFPQPARSLEIWFGLGVNERAIGSIKGKSLVKIATEALYSTRSHLQKQLRSTLDCRSRPDKRSCRGQEIVIHGHHLEKSPVTHQ